MRTFLLFNRVHYPAGFFCSCPGKLTMPHTSSRSIAQPIVAIAVGADVAILLAAPTPGSNLEGTNTSSYDVTSNMPDNKVSAYISDASGAYSGGVQLFATLAAPAAGGTSAGELEIVAGAGNAVDLVTGIPPVQESGLGISYRATAPATTPPAFSEAREITYTITGN